MSLLDDLLHSSKFLEEIQHTCIIPLLSVSSVLFHFFSSELQLFELVVTYAANTLVTDLQINCMLVEHVMDNEGCLCLVFFMGEGIISYNATTTICICSLLSSHELEDSPLNSSLQNKFSSNTCL